MSRLFDESGDPMEMAELLADIPSANRCRMRPPSFKRLKRWWATSPNASAASIDPVQERQDELDRINRGYLPDLRPDLVLDSVEAELPVIGAKGCAISPFLGFDGSAFKIRVIFASFFGKRKTARRVPMRRNFLPVRCLPDGIWPSTDNPYSLYIEPLFFAERRLGYIVMERGIRTPTYPSLASRLASVLEGAFLVRKPE